MEINLTRQEKRLNARSELIERVLLEMGVGIRENDDWPDESSSVIMSETVLILCLTILRIARHNSEPRRIIDKVGTFFDEQIKGGVIK